LGIPSPSVCLYILIKESQDTSHENKPWFTVSAIDIALISIEIIIEDYNSDNITTDNLDNRDYLILLSYSSVVSKKIDQIISIGDQMGFETRFLSDGQDVSDEIIDIF
jgi:hypothetical protein